jgi:integrase
MPTIKFTSRTCDGLRAADRRIDYFDEHTPGLHLRVTSSGVKSWSYIYRSNRRQRRLTLGRYPAVGLKDARDKALKAQAQIADDIDPALVRSEGRNTDTFGALAESYLERHARKFKKSWREDQRLLTKDILPHWRHLPAREITRRLVRDVVERIADRGAPIAANRTLAVISRVFSYAVQRDIVEGNPAYRVAKPGAEQSRDRVLTDAELRELWAALGETERFDDEGRRLARLNSTLNDAFRMRIVTAQRGGEVFRMRWQDVDLESGWWEIPPAFTKNGEIHRVPLTPIAVAILKARQTNARRGAEWVFEHVRPSKVPGREFGNVADRGKKAAAFLSHGDCHLRNNRARTRRRPAVRPGLSFVFQGHDLRRTAATGMAKAGVRRDDVSKVLNHVDRGARATTVYDRYEYDAEKRAALTTWSQLVERIVSEGQ